VFWTWCARVAWIALPLTTGAELTDALNGWSRAPIIVATILLWAAWLAGLVALLAPRPWGFTLLRAVAPAAFALSVAAPVGTFTRLGASVIGFIAMVLALSAPVARASANALAYGDEDRYPLSIPVTLMVLPVPLAALCLTGGVSIGPLLLAAQRYIAGASAVVIGFPLAFVAWNSLNALSRRWLVLVPAGVTLVDPMTTADPTLMPREQVGEITTDVHGAALDLRLGPARGTITIRLRDRAYFSRRRGRLDAEVVEAEVLRIAVVDRHHFFAAAHARHLPIAART
jgi:hypothetical protein